MVRMNKQNRNRGGNNQQFTQFEQLKNVELKLVTLSSQIPAVEPKYRSINYSSTAGYSSPSTLN